MKNNSLFLLLLSLLFFGFISCETKENAEADQTILTIINQDSLVKTEISLFDSTYVVENPDSIQDFVLDMEKPQEITIRTGNFGTRYYMEPGADVSLHISGPDRDADYEYSSTENSDLITFNRNLKIVRDSMRAISRTFKELYTLDKNAFISKLDSIEKEFDKRIDSQETKEDEQAIESYIDLEFFALKSQYPSYHGYYAENENPDTIISSLSEIENIEISSERLNYLSNVKRHIESHIGRNYKGASDIDTFKMALDELDLNSNLKDEIYTYHFMNQFRFNGLDVTKANLDTFLRSNATEREKSMAKEKYASWDKLREGKPSPQFTYENIDGDDVSLEDLKGKYVYIDVWATWCGPCLRELPHLEELQEEMEENNEIAFVSVSIDKDKDKWEKMVREKEMMGYQLYADNAWNSEWVESYNINGIPRFVLLDKENNIVNSDAPRPSNDELKATLITLLEKGEE